VKGTGKMFRSVLTSTNLDGASSSDDESDINATDAMLGGLQVGINTIRSHARTSVGECSSG
jgi:hypothetical protein